MLPYIVAAAEAAFYLLCVPVNLALAVDGGAGLRVGAGVSLFARYRARRRAVSDLAEPNGRRGGPGRGRLWRAARRLRFERIELTGRVSLGDAAATAVLCGALNGAACALRPRTDALRAAVRPDFSGACRLELRGVLTARAGRVAAALFLPELGKEGLK